MTSNLPLPPPPPPNPPKDNKIQQRKGSIVSRYRTTLASISARTGTALPALITSFAVLHELTAVVPLVGVFYACRTFGLGERVAGYLRETSTAGADMSGREQEKANWAKDVSGRWMREGEDWVGRVGRRYGIWGFEKGVGSSSSSSKTTTPTSTAIAGDVANALVAYCATKALLPVRIGVSLYLSPAFARRVVMPVSRSVGGALRSAKLK